MMSHTHAAAPCLRSCSFAIAVSMCAAYFMPEIRRAVAVLAAVTVGRRHRREPRRLLRLRVHAGRGRADHVRVAVVGVVGDDHALVPADDARDADREVDGLGAGAHEVADAQRLRHRRRRAAPRSARRCRAGSACACSASPPGATAPRPRADGSARPRPRCCSNRGSAGRPRRRARCPRRAPGARGGHRTADSSARARGRAARAARRYRRSLGARPTRPQAAR